MSELTLFLSLAAIAGIGFAIYERKQSRKNSDSASRALSDAETQAKELILNAKNEALTIKEDAEKEMRETRQATLSTEQRILDKEEKLEKRLEEILNKEKGISKKIEAIESELTATQEAKKEQLNTLEKVSSMNRKEAEELMITRIEEELSQEVGKKIKAAEERIKEESEEKAREILVDVMKHGATDYVAEYTTSIVKIKDDDIKGRVIGREGRNIKAFERVTGVNVDLDESPGEIRLSCFDPVRREIARVSLEKLIADGRIQPARIEEVVAKTEKDLDQIMYKAGEKLCHDVNVYNLPKELVQLLGRFKYRYSYGQNMIQHTLEETKIGIKLAKELGADANVVRLAGLLHDIGKVLNDDEGSHVDLGVELLKKHGIAQPVIDCVAQHHEDEPFTSVESVIVYVVDAISASRPGARHEDYEAYVKRMVDLEKAATGFVGVKKAFAISAGRELRVIVEPEKVDDLTSYKLARDIANKIERELVYPGQVKVSVVREIRAEETAR